LLQERLLARQAATKKDLSKAIVKAKLKFNAAEIICKEAVEDHEHKAAVRGAFVVFQRREFQEDVLRTTPRGEHMLFGPCAACLLQLCWQLRRILLLLRWVPIAMRHSHKYSEPMTVSSGEPQGSNCSAKRFGACFCMLSPWTQK
jgi:hypothetical protein